MPKPKSLSTKKVSTKIIPEKKIIRKRNWVFTLNNYTEKQETFFKELLCKYIVYGKEVGKNNTPHLQGTIVFDNAKTEPSVRKLMPSAHWEECKSLTDSINYCKKDGDFFEKGEMAGQGKRNDLTKALSKNKNITEFKKNEPELFCKYRNGVKELYSDQVESGVFNPDKEVIYITGKSGQGKTAYARNECKDIQKSEIEFKNTFLLGYREGRKVAIYDEFRDSDITLKDFLKLTDKYSNTFNIKGGDVVFDVQKLYITSIKSPFDIYTVSSEDRYQIFRRITKFIRIEES